MSKIACKMRNSFALDNDGNLFTWGSYENGLLANTTEADILRPNLVEVYDGKDKYCVEKVSAGHFHAAVVANRQGSTRPNEFKYANGIFNELKEWYEEIFVKNIVNPFNFIKLLLRKTEISKENIKYEDFDKYFLQPFYSYQKLNNKDIFKMNKIYQDQIYTEFGLSSKKISFSPSDLVKLSESNNQYLKDLYEFANYCVNHFKKNPEDFPYFVRIIMKFEPYSTQADVINLFEYVYNSEYRLTKGSLDLERPKIIQFFNELKLNQNDKKNDNVVSTNALIDTIERKQTGVGVVFTWGVSSECRLGYSLEEKGKSIVSKKDEEEEGNKEVLKQRIPRIVYFKNVFIRITKIACGYSHTLALSDDHRVYSWGSSKYGCLGNSKSENLQTPEIILKDFEKQDFKEITDIAAGMYFSMALENDGVLYTWGCGNGGRLGHGDENSVGLPKKVNYFLQQFIKISSICCGDTHCAVTSSSKALYTWGNGSYGKLGHGNFEDVKTPLMVEFFNNKKIDLVVCGSYNSMAVTTDLRLYAWGKNSHGMLGIPHMVDQNIILPCEILLENEIKIFDISLGNMHTMLLDSSGSIYTCGNTVNGILAHPDVYDKLTFPKKIEDFKFYESIQKDIFQDSHFKQYNNDFTLSIDRTKYATALTYVVCDANNSAFVTNNGELFMCGESKLICEETNKKEKVKEITGTDSGTPMMKQRGNIEVNNMQWKDTIIKITNPLLSEKVSFVAISQNHVICIADKRPYGWGKNVYGVLGLQSKAVGEIVNTPTLIDKVLSFVKMAAVSDTHTLFLTINGEIYACGSNMYGKLGIGNMNKYFEYSENSDVPFEIEPRLVKNIKFAEYIACSNNHSACIMKYDNKFYISNSVYTWGSGFLGKLGHYDSGDATEPKKVEEFENKLTDEFEKLYFVKVALGDEFTFALDIKGGLWGWGKKKYLIIYDENDDGFQSTPTSVMPKTKFKFITSSSNFCLAITVSGVLYSWGKLSLDGKTFMKTIDKVYCEKMDFASSGINHFCVIDTKINYPLTWGSNLFFKCGQAFANIVSSDNNQLSKDEFQANPRKIDYFHDYFLKNKNILDDEKKYRNNLVDKKEDNIKEKRYQKSNETQLRLIDEKIEHKNLGLISEDFKINQRFYEVIGEYFVALRSIEDARVFQTMKIENNIISIINEAKSKKQDVYKSDVPKIINQNFQIFEAALLLLQMHPCYLQRAKNYYNNKSNFIELVKMVFGRNYINMRNKRVILMLMALWNSIFKEETKAEYNTNLITTDRYEDFITYDLYDLIFKINKENMQIIYEITSELFLFFITEILDKADIIPSKDQDILSYFKEMGDMKKEISQKAVQIISDRISYLFEEMKENLKNNYSFSVIWIYKRISKLFKSEKDSKVIKNQDSQFNKLFNYFLFVPFVDLLKTIKDSYDETQCPEYKIFVKKIPQVLEQNKNKSGFSQLYNLYKSDKTNIENSYFRKVCSPKSDILKQIYDIFVSLSKREIYDFPDAEKYIEKMNETCRHSLKEYQYDFTLTAFKELVKSISENGNESVIVPLSIKDMIDFRECLNFINSSLSGQDSNDPLKSIVTYINEFKLDEIDNNSNIRNFVINFYIKPNSYIYNSLLGIPKLLKCESCLLPIHHVFFEKNYVTEYTEFSNWICKFCTSTNEKHSVKCRVPSCDRPKSKSVIKTQKSFFKLFQIPYEDEEVLLFEEVLFNLHHVSENDDIMKEIGICLDKLRQQKIKEKTKIELLNKFVNMINLIIGNSEDENKAEILKKDKIKKLLFKVDSNFKKRYKHISYLNSLNDFITFLNSNAENAKSNFIYIEKLHEVFIFNLKRGYSNDWAKQIGTLTKVLRNKTDKSDDKKVIKKFLVVELVQNKVIDEILFQGQQQPKLTQKTYMLFEKEEKGFKIKLNYKEKYRKFILCGVNTHEYVLEEHLLPNESIIEMRKNARNNPTINLGDIRFNVFYLVKLLNSLETSE